MNFFKTQHPKNSLLMVNACLHTMLSVGWIGQAKMNGYYVQIHVFEEGIKVYSRKGLRVANFDPFLKKAVLEHFEVGDIFEAEWLKIRKSLHIFDMVATKGNLLTNKSYAERYQMIPNIENTDRFEVLPILDTPISIMAAYKDELTEGVVFKALNTKGFSDTSIVRCRNRQLNDFNNGKANRLRGR